MEKLVGFQDSQFHSEGRALVLSVVEQYNHLKNTRADFAEETLRSKQFADLMEFQRRSMYWEVGRYQMSVIIHVIGMKRPTIRKWRFALTGTDLERLRQNIDEVVRYHKELIAPPPPEASKVALWNWINPVLEPEPS